MEINADLKKLILDLGASDVGFADISVFDIKGYDKAVSITVKMLDSIVDEIKNAPTYEYYAHYKAVNELINHITLRTSLYLEKLDYYARPVSASQSTGNREDYTSSFSHKSAATLSGMGTVGKSGLFVHHIYGPRVRLGTILTNAPLTCGEPNLSSDCGECIICVKACPASALKGVLWQQGMPRNELYDPASCSRFMSNHFSRIGRGFVCGICMAVCPKGKT